MLGHTFEVFAPTLTSDRECDPVANCTLGVTYESVAPTLTNDRKCDPVSTEGCIVGESYVQRNATLTSDIVCVEARQCTSQEEVLLEPDNIYQNRVCGLDAGSSGTSVAGPVAGAVAALVILALLLVVVILRRRRRTQNKPISAGQDETQLGEYREGHSDYEEPAALEETQFARKGMRRGSVSFSDSNVEVAIDQARSPQDGTVDVVISRSPIDAHHVGKRVLVKGFGAGTLRYYGKHATKPGYRCGVELDEAIGKNNGTVGGFWYFDCEDGHGILVSTI